MAAKDVEQYAHDSPFFFLQLKESDISPRLLRLIRDDDVQDVLEMGCGDGNLALYLQGKGYLENKRMTCVDLSRTRLDRIQALSPANITVHQANVEDLAGIPSTTFDLVISQMVIEHVNDSKFLQEAARTLRPGGRLFLTTIFRRSWAWYFYRNPFGERALDPTHLREYTNDEQLVRHLEASGLQLQESRKQLCWFTLATPLFRFIRAITGREDAAATAARMSRWLQVPIAGYYTWELVAVRKP